MLTLHRSYEGEPGSKAHVFYVMDGQKVQRLTGAKAARWSSALRKETRLLATQAHSTDAVLLEMSGRGVRIFYIHWHAAGLPKNLAPEEIAARFSAIPEDQLRPFKPRPDLAELRHLVDARRAILEHRKADQLRLSALRRSIGLSDDDEMPDHLKAIEEEIKADKRSFETPVDRQLAKIGSKIAECQIFNRVSGLSDGYITAATVMAYLGDLGRFPTVSALWHYCGQHVVEGAAPRRKRGEAGDWNPKLRTALWLLGTSMIKNTNNKWRTIYEQFRDAELALHDLKHPKCPTKQGHCGARARRKIIKEILKEFWAAARSTEELQAA